jgi:hypothetical protein
MCFFVSILMAGFVVAVSSEITTDFTIENSPPIIDKTVSVHVQSFWDAYGGQLIAVAVLIIIYILFKMSGKKKPKRSRRKKK